VQEKKFNVIFSPSAQRDIENLEAEPAAQLIQTVAAYLEINPFPIGKPRIKKIRGFEPPLYRLRSGDYRVFYRLIPGQVVILAVRSRKDSEKFLKKINEGAAEYRVLVPSRAREKRKERDTLGRNIF
jgi:mRNA-degrading endonuclease RelE of RelBE toxin-antitoxin system